jgi:cytochrome b
MEASVQAIEVRVWDPLIRSAHWLLAAVVLIDWITDEPLWMHSWLGYLAGALVVLRIVWGFVGPEECPLHQLRARPADGVRLSRGVDSILVEALPRA